MFRQLAALTLAVALPATAFAQAADDPLARARAVDACAGRPVLSAEVMSGNRLNVTCGDAPSGASAGGGLSPGAGAGILVGLLLVLGGLAGGGSSDSTN